MKEILGCLGTFLLRGLLAEEIKFIDWGGSARGQLLSESPQGRKAARVGWL